MADPGRSARLRLGVVGTLVWDSIHDRDPSRPVTEEWGGIAYALGALEALLPAEWDIVPILKVGKDLSERAGHFLAELPRVEADAGVRIVPEANNRVELRYLDSQRRTERLTGGVPPWRLEEIEPVLVGLDALYVNYISGFEMDLDAARGVRQRFAGPIYVDLHSLFLGVSARGVRTLRELPEWQDWIRSGDVIQMNEVEFELMGRVSGDPWGLAASSVGRDVGAILVTLGTNGAAYVAAPDFRPDPFEWAGRRRALDSAAPARSGRVPLEGHAVEGDPTGCGDVWGATCFAALLSGADLEGAMATANLAAGRNVRWKGAAGLHRHLGGRLSSPGALP